MNVWIVEGYLCGGHTFIDLFCFEQVKAVPRSFQGGKVTVTTFPDSSVACYSPPYGVLMDQIN